MRSKMTGVLEWEIVFAQRVPKRHLMQNSHGALQCSVVWLRANS